MRLPEGWLRRWGPGILAWALTCTVPAAFDYWATAKKPEHPTQSGTLGHFLPNEIAGPVLFGVYAGLGYHLFVEEMLIAVGAMPTVTDRYRARKTAGAGGVGRVAA